MFATARRVGIFHIQKAVALSVYLIKSIHSLLVPVRVLSIQHSSVSIAALVIALV